MAFDGFSTDLVWLIFVAITIGVVTAYLLYRGAHIKKEVQVNIPPTSQKKESGYEPSPSSSLDIQKKIEKIPLSAENPGLVKKQIEKLVHEEAQTLLKDVRQEFAVKEQLIIQEKNKEVELIRKEVQEVRKRYEQIDKGFKRAVNEKKQTEAVVRGVAEGLVVVNDKGQVLLMNDTAEKMLGVEKEKKIGKKITDDIPDELLISLAKDSGPNNEEKVVEFVSKNDNVKKVLRSSSAIIQNEEGQTVGMLNILTDVTKQRELDEMKKNFVANVTHELRTPIVAMQKATAILTTNSAGPLNETQTNFLSIVSRNLSQLARLVEDLLDVAKIDSGKMKLKLAPTRIDKVLVEACDTLDTWAKSKTLEIIRNIDKNFPEIWIDPDKVTQVLNNLISNAIKFTPPGGKITIGMTWDADPSFVKVSVADTGVGISKEDLTKLFRRFEQFGDQQGIVGTGLGLSISKEIVERHGGRIWAESHERQGSIFSFTLPLRPRMVPTEPGN